MAGAPVVTVAAVAIVGGPESGVTTRPGEAVGPDGGGDWTAMTGMVGSGVRIGNVVCAPGIAIVATTDTLGPVGVVTNWPGQVVVVTAALVSGFTDRAGAFVVFLVAAVAPSAKNPTVTTTSARSAAERGK